MNEQAALQALASNRELEAELAEQALTMTGCTIVGQFEYHANRIEKIRKKMKKNDDVIEQYITGAGTGNE